MENLWLMDADGKNRRAITSGKDAYVRERRLDARRSVLLIARREDAKPAGIPPVELWMFHRDGGNGIKLVAKEDVPNALGAERVARRPLHLFLRAQNQVHLRARHGARPLAHRPLRPADRRARDVDHRLRRRGAAERFARTATRWSSSAAATPTPCSSSAICRPAPSG